MTLLRKVLFVFVAVLLAHSSAHAAGREFVNGVAVIVNERVITYQEIKNLVAPEISLLERRYARDLPTLEKKVLELQEDAIKQLVEHELILHDFATAGYNLPESIIDEEIKRRVREQFGDRITMTKTLQARGMTFEKFRETVREQIVVSQLRSLHVSSSLIISPYKVEKYYLANQEDYRVDEEIKLRMIVVNQPEGAVEGRADKLAKEILIKLDEGAPFEEMAKVYSEGSKAADGGDWGWVQKKVLRKDLADYAFDLKKGQRSGLISTSGASFIMMVDDRRPSRVRPLADVADEIESMLLSAERARLQEKYISRLRKKQFIRYF